MKYIFLLLFLYPSLAMSQQAPYDSLESLLLKEKTDTQKLNIIKQLVDIAFGSDMQKALDYSRAGVKIAEASNDKNWLPKFYEMEGRMHANLLHLDSAFYFFNKAMTGYKLVENQKGQATTFFKMGWVYKKRGQMDSALTADLSALKIMKDIGEPLGLAAAYERVSDDLTVQERFAEAKEYALLAIDICKRNNLEQELVYALTSAGSVAIMSNDPQAAYNYFDEALKLANKEKFNEISLSDFLNNRGNALKHLGRYDEALKDYTLAHDKAVKANYRNAITATIANLAELNMLKKDYKAALPFQLETVQAQEQNNDLSNLTEAYLHLSTIYENIGDYKSALSFQKKALHIRDSIASAASDTTMSGLLTRYQTKEKEGTIQAQQKEISQQRKTQWLGGSLIVLLVAFLIFGFISYRGRTKRTRLLATKNNENELLLKEIHHRVKNNLEVVSSLLALQSAQTEDAHTKDAMRESENRIHSIGIVHQKLYQGTHLGSVDMKDYFLNLSESVLDTFGAEARVKIELVMDSLQVDIDTAVPLGLIVNELLTNTLKYAFPEGKKGNVKINLEKRPGGSLHLQVSDNGVGKTDGMPKGTGFGSQLISLLTRQLNGKMSETIENGMITTFDFKPVKAA